MNRSSQDKRLFVCSSGPRKEIIINKEEKDNIRKLNNTDEEEEKIFNCIIPRRGYQLRAFKECASSTIGASDIIPNKQTLPDGLDVNISSLSSELVNETLNYFVNCRQRLNQMTKTYDDTDAYILLLQEKEVDLELAARIGQDLLRQNKQLRECIEDLEKQLSNRQDDIQQLKHELATKNNLLDTFIEEEEEQHFMQQEKILLLQEQLIESDKRLLDVSTQNSLLQKTIIDSDEARKELYEELDHCKKNFSDLLRVFMELQNETREQLMREQLDQESLEHHSYHDQHYNSGSRPQSNCNDYILTSSLLEELQESMQKDLSLQNDDYINDIVINKQENDDDDDDDDGRDSGVHTNGTTTTLNTLAPPISLTDSASTSTSQRSTSITPCTNTSLCETDSEDNLTAPGDLKLAKENRKKTWVGFSSYILTSILIFCLSVTITSTANLNLAHRLQFRLDR